MDCTKEKKQGHCNFLETISLAISGSLESFFYRWGFLIASHPWKFIVGCLVFTIACSAGLLGLNIENRPINLWIPWNSDFIKDTEWLKEHFPSPIRFHYAIIAADNVLDPKIIQLLQNIHETVGTVTANDRTWQDLCFKLPVTKYNQESRRRRRRRHVHQETSANVIQPEIELAGFEDSFSEPFFGDDYSLAEFDPSVDLPSDVYCDIVNSLEEACWESSINELWSFNSSVISNLSKQDILNVVNTHSISPIFGRPVNYTRDLSGIERNETGHIVKANGILLRWYAKINQTLVKNGKTEMDRGTGETVDIVSMRWETELKNTLLDYPLPDGVKMYLKFARSFGDISDSTIWGDGYMLGAGFSIVFIYVFFMLGQCNMIYQRPILAMAGISCIGLAILVSYGLCSSVNLIYSPVHNVLPFLLLGIGIDDMFVIMQCWNNLSPSLAKLPLQERVALALKHAGVSITVTSLTDFAAFAVGGTTVLPALQSFCIYAACGVIATYIFQATFFTSWLVLDMRRVEDNRNAYIICYKHKNYVPSSCSEQNFAQRFFGGIYSKLLLSKAGKIFILLFTFSFFGVNLWGNTNLKQKFDPAWFLPSDTHLYKYLRARDVYFPAMGHEAFIVTHNVNLNTNLEQYDALASKLETSKFIHEVDCWYTDFKRYSNMHFGTNIPHTKLSDKKFDKYMGKFLYSPSGSKYRARFKFAGNLTCGESAPPVLTSLITFKFRSFKGPEEHIPAMNEIKSITRGARNNFTSEDRNNSFLWSFGFAAWETDEIITVEMYRNMGLAMACVLVTTLFLIANLLTCLMVLFCVILTLVDVLGGMYFWGLTIDTVSCIDLVLAIGLCVDYAAHIGHAFMTNQGSRDKRSKQALRDIGPAVLNGGFSTFLALLLVSTAKSHVFISFFKIFTMVVMYGLYHGLVFLPVLLSICGSSPYKTIGHKTPTIEPDSPEDHTLTLLKQNGHSNGHKNGHIGNGNIHVYQPVDLRQQSVGI